MKARGPGFYVVIWAVLVALTLLSFAGSRLGIGGAELVLALGIALVKSALVGLFFMHLWEQRTTQIVVPLITGAFVVLLITLMVTDVRTRHTFPRAPFPQEAETGTALDQRK